MATPACQGNMSASTSAGWWNHAYPPNTSSAASPDNATVERYRTARNSRYSEVSVSPMMDGLSYAATTPPRRNGSIRSALSSTMSVWSQATSAATSWTYGRSGVPNM